VLLYHRHLISSPELYVAPSWATQLTNSTSRTALYGDCFGNRLLRYAERRPFHRLCLQHTRVNGSKQNSKERKAASTAEDKEHQGAATHSRTWSFNDRTASDEAASSRIRGEGNASRRPLPDRSPHLLVFATTGASGRAGGVPPWVDSRPQPCNRSTLKQKSIEFNGAPPLRHTARLWRRPCHSETFETTEIDTTDGHRRITSITRDRIPSCGHLCYGHTHLHNTYRETERV